MELMAKQKALVQEILALKKKKHAIILAHNYQRPEIYSVADYVGDSLGLCEAATKSRLKRIIFCGVKFMAESAKILNPRKDVYIPALDAGCALADSITAEQIRKLKKRHPLAAVVCYINSSAEIKAECDTICTSSNAVEVVRALKNKEIIMLPDKNLAKFVASQVRGKKIIPTSGVCPIHHNLGPKAILAAKQEHPGAKLIVHPECQTNVLELADFIGSTSRMSDYAKKSGAKEFIVVTECGMINKMQEDAPNKKFYTVCSLCYDMKKITLERVLDALKYDQYKIEVEPKVAKKARDAFEKMFKLTRKK